jgi:hypothetical protein
MQGIKSGAGSLHRNGMNPYLAVGLTQIQAGLIH